MGDDRYWPGPPRRPGAKPIAPGTDMASNAYGTYRDLLRRQENEDEAEGFSLPIFHRPEENLDLENVEQASLDKPIESTNIGYRLLKLMGWRDNTGLGRDGTGMVEPIRPTQNMATLGLGKVAEDQHYAEVAAQKRKLMDTEIEETEEMKQKREMKAATRDQIQTHLSDIMKTFYCELCNKQYKNVHEIEMHLDSYDHNHKKRFLEMKKAGQGVKKMMDQKKEQGRALKEQERALKKPMPKAIKPASAAAPSAAAAPTAPTQHSSDASLVVPPLPAGSAQPPLSPTPGVPLPPLPSSAPPPPPAASSVLPPMPYTQPPGQQPPLPPSQPPAPPPAADATPPPAPLQAGGSFTFSLSKPKPKAAGFGWGKMG